MVFPANRTIITQHLPIPQEQLELKIRELRANVATIEEMDISDEWKSLATNITINRGWRKIDDAKKSSLLTIAHSNSKALATIVYQTHTKLSLEKMETIATIVTNEADRIKIMELLLNNSWEKVKKSIYLIIASYGNKDE
ncbi:hypothetical protein [Sulfurovum mangrovi]|uniref:hypothetical protein n=1 Tax=Sulfurovum mangrovi TaxID=2893889 RepID=UPI001E4FE324|nr:hypothetical protein [Sulfurovum mangrovi]UFH60477.1 hypothetical protein LN246_06365 [Sulfurovum mangrovi]